MNEPIPGVQPDRSLQGKHFWSVVHNPALQKVLPVIDPPLQRIMTIVTSISISELCLCFYGRMKESCRILEQILFSRWLHFLSIVFKIHPERLFSKCPQRWSNQKAGAPCSTWGRVPSSRLPSPAKWQRGRSNPSEGFIFLSLNLFFIEG